MSQQIIDIGVQGNDGTGDSIRESFRKANANFTELYAVFGAGGKISFKNLSDAPASYGNSQIIMSNTTGSALVARTLVPGSGIQINTTNNAQVTISSSPAGLANDNNPSLIAPLNANGFILANTALPSQTLVNSFNTLYGTNITLGDVLINKSYADTHYLPLTTTTSAGGSSVSSVSSALRVRSQPLIPQISDPDYNASLTSNYLSTEAMQRKDVVYRGGDSMSGPLVLNDHPSPITGTGPQDSTSKTAATKYYVDQSTFSSNVNLYVSANSGDDLQQKSPAGKQGRFWNYSYKTIGAACLAADGLQNLAQVEPGPYRQRITYTLSTSPTQYYSTTQGTPTLTGGNSAVPGYPDARALLEANKTFIQNEVVSYINNKYVNVFSYSKSTMQTNLSNLIDAVAYDLVFQSTYNTSRVATSILASTGTASLAQTIDAINYAASQISNYNFASTNLTTYITNICTALGNDLAFGTNYQSIQQALLFSTAGTLLSASDMSQLLTNLSNNILGINSATTITPGTLVTTATGTQGQTTLTVGSATGLLVGMNVIASNIPNGATISSIVGTVVSISGGTFTGAVTGNVTFGTNSISVASSAGIATGQSVAGSNIAPGSTVTTISGSTIILSLPTLGIVSGTGQFTTNNTANQVSQAVTSVANNIATIQGIITTGVVPTPSFPSISGVTSVGQASAASLLLNNIPFIQAEVIAYITANSASYPGISYSQAKCKRDVQYIVWALVYDLLYGGNSATVTAGNAYYNGAILQVAAAEKQATLDAYNYVNTLAQAIITNTSLSTQYQQSIIQYQNTTLINGTVASTSITNNIATLESIINYQTVVTPTALSFSGVSSNITAVRTYIINNSSTFASNAVTYQNANFPTVTDSGTLTQISTLFGVATSLLSGGIANRLTPTYTAPSTTITSQGVQNAAYLILLNISFLVDDALGYTKQNSLSYYNAITDTVAWRRQLKYILEALVYDVYYGGTSGGILSATLFYANGVDNTILSALSRISSNITGSIINNTAVNPNYLSNISSTNTQYINGALTGGSAAAGTNGIIPTFFVNVNSILGGSTPPNPTYPSTTGYNSNYISALNTIRPNELSIAQSTTNYLDATYQGGFSYNQATCLRDVGLIIEAMAIDLIVGGTYQTVNAGKSYYRNASALLAIGSQYTQTLDAIKFAKTVALQCLNQTTANRYQTSYTQQTNATLGTSYTSAPQAITDFTNNMNTIISIITNGIGAAPTPTYGTGVWNVYINNGGNTSVDQGKSGSNHIIPAKALVGANSGATGLIVTYTPNVTTGQDLIQIRLTQPVLFTASEQLDFGETVNQLNITIFVESGIYYEDYPIRLPKNTSIKGDEFRRTIIRPLDRISQSYWRKIFFYRDAVIDANLIGFLDTTYDFATNNLFSGVTANISGTTGNITITFPTTVYVPSLYIGKVITVGTGQAVITSVSNNLANCTVIYPFASTGAFTSGNWHMYGTINYGRHYLTNPLDITSTPKNNKLMDVFLCNDQTRISNVTFQGHGGFAMVLDPEGQIKTKSPYGQVASSFSQSINAKRFAGGQYVDGFAGRLRGTITSISYNAITGFNTASLVNGSGYTPASGTQTYTNVALTGGTGSGATGSVTVTNGAVVNVTISNLGTGTGYTVGDTISCANSSIGGTGYGFSIPISTTSGSGLYITVKGTTSATGTYVSGGVTNTIVVNNVFGTIQTGMQVNAPNTYTTGQTVTGVTTSDNISYTVTLSSGASQTPSGTIVFGLSSGLDIRAPQPPCAFYVSGNRYQVDDILSFTPSTGTVVLVLDAQTPYNPTANYDQPSNSRDTGTFIDAVTSDMVYGTNYRSTHAAINYQNRYTLSQLLKQQISTIAGVNYQASLATASSGTVYTTYAPAVTALNNYFGIITNVLQNGSSSAPAVTFTAAASTTTNQNNARLNLQKNKIFIEQEGTAWLNSQPTATILGTSTTVLVKNIPNYNAVTYQQQVGYLIDAICYDLIYGGNSATYDFVQSFYLPISFTVSATNTSGNITINSNALARGVGDLAVGNLILFGTSFNGITANTPYYITNISILSAGTQANIVVSTTPGGSNSNPTASGSVSNIASTAYVSQIAGQEGYYLAMFNHLNTSSSTNNGVTGTSFIRNIILNTTNVKTLGNNQTQDTTTTAATSAEQTTIDTLMGIVQTGILYANLTSVSRTTPTATISDSNLTAAQTAIVNAKSTIQSAVLTYINAGAQLGINIEAGGNKSMLANDFAMINDLGYAIFCNNGGVSEQVSTFSYYCWTHYWANNGGQIRSVAGSNAHGQYGLRASGSDVTELPNAVNLQYDMVQTAQIYQRGPYAGTGLGIKVDSTKSLTFYIVGYSYAPFNVSEIEIDHTLAGGNITRYLVSTISHTPVYYGNQNVLQITLGTSGVNGTSATGLAYSLYDGQMVQIRILQQALFYNISNVNPTRPSTALQYGNNLADVYRIIAYNLTKSTGETLAANTAVLQSDSSFNYYKLNTDTYNISTIDPSASTISITGGSATGSLATVTFAALSGLTGVVITGTAGQFSYTSGQSIQVGQAITISGTYGGTGSISGYVTGTTYYVIATNGQSTFTLSASYNGTALTTTAGTPTGLTYLYAPFVPGQSIVINNVSPINYNGPWTVTTCTTTSVTFVSSITSTYVSGGVIATASQGAIIGDSKIAVLAISAQSTIDQLNRGLYVFTWNGRTHRIISYTPPVNIATAFYSSGGTATTLTVTGGTYTSSTVTLNFASQGSAPFAAGQTITVAGMTPSGYNGTQTVVSSTATSVTYSNSTNAAITVNGTVASTYQITVTNVAGTITAGQLVTGGNLLNNAYTTAGNVTVVSTNLTTTAGSTSGTITVSGLYANAPVNGYTLTFGVFVNGYLTIDPNPVVNITTYGSGINALVTTNKYVPTAGGTAYVTMDIAWDPVNIPIVDAYYNLASPTNYFYGGYQQVNASINQTLVTVSSTTGLSSGQLVTTNNANAYVPSGAIITSVSTNKTQFTFAPAGWVPAGTNLSAQSLATLASITISTPGTGYTSPPTVTVSGGGVTDPLKQAIVTVSLSAGSVTGFVIVSPGYGYTSQPSILVSAPTSGITAVLTPVLSSNAVINTVALAGINTIQSTIVYNSDPGVAQTGTTLLPSGVGFTSKATGTYNTVSGYVATFPLATQSSAPTIGNYYNVTAGTYPIVAISNSNGYVTTTNTYGLTVGALVVFSTFNISTTATATNASGNVITVGTTTGMNIGNTITFTGTSIGGLSSGTAYFIVSIPSLTTLTVSATQGGSSITLTTGSGSMVASITPGGFGGLTHNSCYYITSIVSATQFTIAATASALTNYIPATGIVTTGNMFMNLVNSFNPLYNGLYPVQASTTGSIGLFYAYDPSQYPYYLNTSATYSSKVTATGAGYLINYTITSPGFTPAPGINYSVNGNGTSAYNSYVYSPGGTTTNTVASSSSTSLTVASTSSLIMVVGTAISGSGIPANTTITAINTSTNVITLSQTATVTINTTLTLGNTTTNLQLLYTSDPLTTTTASAFTLGSGAISATTSYVNTAGTTAYLVVYTIPTQPSAPQVGAWYTVAGNSTSAYNGTFKSYASTTASLTLIYLTNVSGPGTSTGNTVTPTISIVGGSIYYLNQSVTTASSLALGIGKNFTTTTSITLRAGYPANSSGQITVRISTCRASGHDFLDIGTGSYVTTNYPYQIYGNPAQPRDQTHEIVEEGVGRVFYVTTDQNGIFRVGRFFTVDQGTGTVTFSASIALSNLDGLGFKRGVVVAEFSTDATMTNNASDTVPVQSAVRGYVDARLGITQGDVPIATSSRLGPGMMPLDGKLSMTGAMNLGGNQINNLGYPLSSGDGASKLYVDTQIATVNAVSKLTDTLITTSNITNGSLLVFDDYAGTTLTVLSVTPSSPSVGSVTLGFTAQGSVPYSTGQTIYVQGINPSDYNGAYTVTGCTSSSVTYANITTTSYVSGGTITTGRWRNIVLPTTVSANNDVALIYTSSTGIMISSINSGVIVNSQVSATAAISQGKLSLNLAGTAASSPSSGSAQASSGVASFNSAVFTTTNGWADLLTSSSTSTGIQLGKIAQISTNTVLSNLSGSTASPSSNTTGAIVSAGDGIKNANFNGGGSSIPVGAMIVNYNSSLGTSSNGYSIIPVVASATASTIAYRDSNNTTNFATLNATSLQVSGNTIHDVSSSTLNFYTPGGYKYATAVGANSAGFTFSALAGTWDFSAVNPVKIPYITSGSTSTVGQITGNWQVQSSSIWDVTRGTLYSLTLSTGSDSTGGVIQGNWTLNGASRLQATYADLAEFYEGDQEYEPGTVLVFGGDKEVTTSSIMNDTHLAGVVTTNPAYVMNSEQKGIKVCLALAGRVPCKVIGRIKKGDMLTTSATPGYAVKALNPTLGAIIGKAIEDKDYGEAGVISVAVGRM